MFLTLVSIFRGCYAAKFAEYLGKILSIQRIAHQLCQTADLHIRLEFQKPLRLRDAGAFQISRKPLAGHLREDAPQVVLAHEQPLLRNGL